MATVESITLFLPPALPDGGAWSGPACRAFMAGLAGACGRVRTNVGPDRGDDGATAQVQITDLDRAASPERQVARAGCVLDWETVKAARYPSVMARAIVDHLRRCIYEFRHAETPA